MRLNELKDIEYLLDNGKIESARLLLKALIISETPQPVTSWATMGENAYQHATVKFIK